MSTLTIDADAVVTAGSTDAAAPLLVLLHGFGSNEGDLIGLAPYLPAAYAVASLPAPLALGPGQRAWFPIATPGRPDVATVDAAADAVLAWLDVVHPDRAVSLLGFSQGGALVTQLFRRAPQRFVAGVVLAGFSVDTVTPGDAELAERRPPIFYGRGTVDRVIAPDATRRTVEWLPEHSTLTMRVYAGLAHAISPDELEDVAAFLRATL
ncbi:alpha/beta fold hydrolase [Microbacteriaceae bacterium VKM Ac-2854]|nr:alpha/beta fold hydrolase [Microbacteriaceae bacterium VKM Ac-2854]